MLKNRIREARQNDEGFTLIELLIVIIVLGILAGIVVFGVGTFRQDSEDAVACADAKTVNVAADAWFAKNGTQPTLAQLVADNYIETAPGTITYDPATGTAVATGVTC